MVDVDDVAPGREEVDRLAVEASSLVDVAHLARPVQDRVDLLVTGQGGVQAALARLVHVDVAVGIHAPAPADQERLQLAVVVVGQRRGELLGAQRDVEAGLTRHLLDDLGHAAFAGIVDHRHLEAVATGVPGVGQELLGARHVAPGALPALVEEDADRRDRRAARRVETVPRDLVQRLPIDAELERFANARVVGQRRPEVGGRVLLARLVAQVDRDALIAEPGHVRQLELSLALDAGRVGRRHLVHHVDVTRAQIGQSHVVVGNDPEDDLVELCLARIEVVGGLLDDDAILRDALGELPRTHADRRGAEFLAELVDRRRRERHSRAVGELGDQRRERRLQAQANRERINDLDSLDRCELAGPIRALQGAVPVQ